LSNLFAFFTAHAPGILACVPADLAAEHTARLTRAPLDEALAAQLQADEALACSLSEVWLASPWIAEACIAAPSLLTDLCLSGDLRRSVVVADFQRQAHAACAGDEASLQQGLRQLRRREMVRMAWRDIAGLADLDETLAGVSGLAEGCVDAALQRLTAIQQAEWGVPRNEAGVPQSLAVMGMGKFGAWELNFSSDIDLIFAFPEEGETDGPRSRSNGEFFNRLAQRLIRALHDVTADGYVFRVDMRLRPYGDSGPLVMSFAAMEEYYQLQGRDWERYALIKARIVGGDRNAGDALLHELQPFVYRRYLDFEAFAALRDMKAMIARQVSRKGMEDNIKLGAGGIREIEFIGQAFQLVRGGRQLALRERRIQRVLAELGTLGHLPPYAVDELLKAYRFLRIVENRLQQMYDGQTHELPSAPLDQLRLAHTLKYPDWAAFLAVLNEHRRHVEDHFQQTFAAPQAQKASAGEPMEEPSSALWNGQVSLAEAQGLLQGLGYAQPEAAWQLIQRVRDAMLHKPMGARGKERFDQLMPMLIQASARTEQGVETLQRTIRVLEKVAGRTAYLALLLEQPVALSQLVRLCGASAWIAEYFAQHPVLLDELMDPRALREPPQRENLTDRLHESLAQVATDDLEQQMDVLRQFKQVNTLRVAVSDVTGTLPLMRVSDCLTDIAIVILQQALALAWGQLTAKHGVPQYLREGQPHTAAMAIIAYGKLGGIELGYGSDLDIVFVHDSDGEEAYTSGEKSLDNATFFARVAQRLIHILQTLTPSGVLYQVDVRLRPSGNSGPLVSSLRAFRDYQRESAWTWEHQALVRARPVAGADTLAEAFYAIRRDVLTQPRDARKLQQDVRDMRARMIQELAEKDPQRFDLKQGQGGITDIEFIVQYNVLRWAPQYPELLTYPDNIRILDGLAAAGLLASQDARQLADAYRAYRAAVHRRKLQEQKALVDADEFLAERREIVRIWRQLFEDDATN
jgi:[glutamine synthetase] adenylyltransferase / [glutamine synthetase]-adenylyl-L-tyrosine phosphorylase